MRTIRWGGRFLLLAGAAYLCAGLYPLLHGRMVEEGFLLPAVMLLAMGWVATILARDEEPDPP